MRIASQKKLKEDSEVALLLLMNAINGRDYAKFYDLLEQDGNKLLKHLVSEIDDASVDHWNKDNYTNFIGALVYMFNSRSQEGIR